MKLLLFFVLVACCIAFGYVVCRIKILRLKSEKNNLCDIDDRHRPRRETYDCIANRLQLKIKDLFCPPIMEIKNAADTILACCFVTNKTPETWTEAGNACKIIIDNRDSIEEMYTKETEGDGAVFADEVFLEDEEYLLDFVPTQASLPDCRFCNFCADCTASDPYSPNCKLQEEKLSASCLVWKELDLEEYMKKLNSALGELEGFLSRPDYLEQDVEVVEKNAAIIYIASNKVLDKIDNIERWCFVHFVFYRQNK